MHAGVHDLHPIGCVAVGLYLVDHDGRRIVFIGGALCLLSQAECTRAIGIAPVGSLRRVAVIGGMRCPAILIQQIAAFVVQADGIAGANADGRFKRAFCKGFCLIVINQTAALGIHHQQCSRGDRASLREAPAVIDGVVPQLIARNVQRLRAGIHQFHPIIGAGVDLVEHQRRLGGGLGLRRLRRGIYFAGRSFCVGKAAVGLSGPRAGCHAGIGIAVDLLSVSIIQDGGVCLTQTEVKVDRFFENQKSARFQNGSLRQGRSLPLRLSFLAFIIGQIPAGEVYRL